MAINIGIVAHVDAGKTTLTEQMLALAEKRQAGRVDAGTAVSDFLEIERERGISVRAAAVRLRWNEMDINIIDTPGHSDFIGEVERSLRVLDGAILVISAVEGVQSQTEVVWRGLRALGIPTLVFINKIDRAGANCEKVLAQARQRLSPHCAFFTAPDEILSDNDETFLADYLENRVTDAQREKALINQVHTCGIFPIWQGCALQGKGVAELLDAVTMLLPRQSDIDKPVLGIVFAVEHDANMGRVAHVRLFEGKLRNREAVFNQTTGDWEKVTQIRRVRGVRREDIGELWAGDIAAVYGLAHVKVGDVLGEGIAPRGVPLAQPLLRVKATPDDAGQYGKMVQAFEELAAEDTLLTVLWRAEERELLVHIMGLIQLEVLTRVLVTRFGLAVTFGAPTVLYRETPTGSAQGFVAYTMPKPCWAVIELWIEPGEPGSGLVVENRVTDHDGFWPRYQRQVLETIPRCLDQGPLGWEVTDLKVTLIGGGSHKFHTHPMDFFAATPMAFMDGLKRAGTGLLEPMLRFRISVPEDVGNKLVGELLRMRAELDAPVLGDGVYEVEGLMPVATSLEFPMRLASMSGGKGLLSQTFGGYRACALELGATTPYRGVNPLDTAKYILYIRNALGRERD